MKKYLLIILSFFLVPAFVSGFACKCFADTSRVYVIKIEDHSINPVTADHIIRSIKKAETADAECLIIELDTPGGLLTSTRAIVKKILSSRVPVVVYVYPSGSRAGSAGVFITYASHVAAMSPSTNIGAAHPVNIGGEKNSWKEIRKIIDSFTKKKNDTGQAGKDKAAAEEGEKDILAGKILQDTTAFIRSIAEQRGRNSEWAEKSVTESSSITEKAALEKGVVEIIASDIDDLLDQLDGLQIEIDDKMKVIHTRTAGVTFLEMDFRQRFLNILANPNIAYILLLLGFYGLLYEVTHPGIGFPGVAGAICIILAFFSMQTLPTNYAGLALIFLGILLFIAEVKAPGFGLLTLGGLVCMVLGSLILFESTEKIMRVSLSLITSFSLATAGLTVFLVRAVFIAHGKKSVSGMDGIIGETGRSAEDFDAGTEGQVFVHGEIWNATANENVSKGDKIKVVSVKGMVLIVEKY